MHPDPGLGVGSVITASFPVHRPGAHEQEGYRPAVVVGMPGLIGEMRFPVLIVAPMTTDRGQEWTKASPRLYVPFSAGTAGLRSPSVCLLDQVRALSFSRVHRVRGTLEPREYRPIREGLLKIFAQAG